MTFDEFVSRYLGTKNDYDNVYGVQCVDLVNLYLEKVFSIKAGAWGNAKDYWTSFSSHKELTEKFDKIPNTPDLIFKKGDIVVWNGNISTKNDCGHIAIATGEGSTSFFYSYDQNWGTKEMKRVYHNFYAVYGVLRPKALNKSAKPPKVKNGTYTLTNARGIYNGAGASTKRKKVADLTTDGKRYATSTNPKNEAYLKAGTRVTILETRLISTGNLWARVPSGWLCIWEYNKDKIFIK